MPGKGIKGNPNNDGVAPEKNQVALDLNDRGTLTNVNSPKNATVLGTPGNVTLTDDAVGDGDTQLESLIGDIATELGLTEAQVADLLNANGATIYYTDVGGGDIEVHDSNGDGTGDASTLSVGDVVNLGNGNDVIWGDDDSDKNPGNDIIFAGRGNDQIRGDGGNDLLFGQDGNDVLTGDAGADYLDGGADNDEANYESSPAGVTVDLMAGTGSGGDAEGDTLVDIEKVVGSDHEDHLYGDGGDNVLDGGDGDDELVGRAGDDTLLGGDGDDTAGYSGDFADYAVTVDIGDDYSRTFTVSGPDGTDTVRDVETLSFADQDIDLDANVLVFDESGVLVGTESTIQNGVDAASDGYTLVLAGVTFAESVNVDKPLDFVGSGAGSTVVEPGSGDGFTIADLSASGSDGDVSFAGLSVNGSTGGSGIRVPDASGMDTLTVVDSSFANNLLNGVAVFGDNVASVLIEDSTFTGNGGNPTSAGDGDVLFYQYEGDATLTNVSITGDGSGENGIQLRDDGGVMGNVTLENVTISGDYSKVGLAVYNYADISGLSATNVTISADTGWELPVNFDGIGGDIDYSALDIDTSASTGVVALQGNDTAQEIIAGDIDTANPLFDTVLNGKGGADTIEGGGGIEAIYGGDGADMLTGGLAGDTFFYTSAGEGGDSITDFSGASGEGDAIDLTALNLSAGTYTTVEELRDHGYIREDGGQLFVDLDGDLTDPPTPTDDDVLIATFTDGGGGFVLEDDVLV